MYPKWYTELMNQLEADYAQGLISYEEYNRQAKDIDANLEEYYEN